MQNSIAGLWELGWPTPTSRYRRAGWGQSLCMFSKFPGTEDAAGPGLPFGSHGLRYTPCCWGDFKAPGLSSGWLNWPRERNEFCRTPRTDSLRRCTAPTGTVKNSVDPQSPTVLLCFLNWQSIPWDPSRTTCIACLTALAVCKYSVFPTRWSRSTSSSQLLSLTWTSSWVCDGLHT